MSLDVQVGVTLPRIASAAVVALTRTSNLATTLPRVTVAITISEGHLEDITAAITLPRIVPAIIVSSPTEFLAIHVRLSRLRVVGYARSKATVSLYSGDQIRQQGSAILTFQGPPNRSIQWGMVEGGGMLIPLSLMTDEQGVAFCRYEPGDTMGTVIVGVRYVP